MLVPAWNFLKIEELVKTINFQHPTLERDLEKYFGGTVFDLPKTLVGTTIDTADVQLINFEGQT